MLRESAWLVSGWYYISETGVTNIVMAVAVAITYHKNTNSYPCSPGPMSCLPGFCLWDKTAFLTRTPASDSRYK